MHVVGTAGHVDHGKSTLVAALTGIDPDRFAEEKRRGLTIDLGFAWVRLPSGAELGLIDVPGHERFIKNMLAGAGGISVCLFVVAANEGWMPQSAEHLCALDVLGVSHGVVALTKADLVAPDELEARITEVHDHLAPSSLAGAEIVCCSGATHDGLDDLLAALDRAVAGAPPTPDLDRPRLWVDRAFTMTGAGTVVTGTLAGGGFAAGDEVEISPEGRRARVRAIQSHKKELPQIGPGNRVALNLAGLDRHGARRGDAVVRPARWRPTRLIDAVVRVAPESLSGRAHELTEKGSHLLYVGSAETPVAVKLLGRARLTSGERGLAQLALRDPLPLARGDRFVLRDAGRIVTFGGGIVLDPLPGRAQRNDPERIASLERLDGAAPQDALTALVDAAGELAAAEALLRSGAATIPLRVTQIGRFLVSPRRLTELQASVRAALAAHHENHPLERGLQRESLRAALGLEPDAFADLMAPMDDVAEEGARVRLTSHAVAYDPQQLKAHDELIARLDGAGYAPPPASELEVDPTLLRAMTEAGELVRIGDFYLTSVRATEARATVRARIEEAGPQTVAQIRDLLDTTRRYAVPLCEWLDHTGATIRKGDVRSLGPTA